jgi:hypothetical protein
MIIKKITEIQRTDYRDKNKISTINKIVVIALLNRCNLVSESL